MSERFDEEPEYGSCDNCGEEDILEYYDCCNVNLCSWCARRHDIKYREEEEE